MSIRPNRARGSARARYPRLHSARHVSLLDLGVHHHVVHVDQVLAQGFEIDLRPIGGRIGLENSDDLGDGCECRLRWRGDLDGTHLMH